MTRFLNWACTVPTEVYIVLTVIFACIAVWVWYSFIKFFVTEYRKMKEEMQEREERD